LANILIWALHLKGKVVVKKREILYSNLQIVPIKKRELGNYALSAIRSSLINEMRVRLKNEFIKNGKKCFLTLCSPLPNHYHMTLP